MRLIKWLLGFIVTLTVLILAAIIIVPMVFDPNDYRQEITDLVRDKTGRELTLDGELKVTVFPWVGIRTEGLSLSQPSEIGGDMLSVQTAQLKVKLTPLFSKQVHIDTIVLEQPSVRLVTLKNGTDSFSGLVSSDSEVSEKATDESDAAGAAVALAVQGLELTNGHLVIDDQSTGSKTEITDLNLITGNLLGASLEDVSISGVLISSDSPDSVQFKLNALAKIDVDSLSVKLQDIVSTIVQANNNVEIKVASIDVIDSSKINLAGLQLALSGPATANITASKISADLNAQTASIPEILFNAGELKGSITELRATKIMDAPKASGKISIPSFSVAKLLKDFEIDYQTADPNVLQSVALSADFAGSTDGAEVKNLLLKLDSSELKGSAAVTNFEKPRAKFDLVLDSLNIDSYLPATQEGAEEQSASGGEALAVPMAVFKDINANGQFKAQRLIAGGMKMDNIDVQVRSTPGKVTIIPNASIYEGGLGGEIAYEEVGNAAKLKVKNEISLVQLGSLLTDIDLTDQLSGLGSILVDLVVSEENGVQTNNGTVKLSAQNGAIKGIDIKGMIDKVYAKVKAKDASSDSETSQSSASDETRFAELSGTFNINNNIITNNDLNMKAPLFRVGGEGTIDAEKQTLDYLVEVKVVASTDGQGGEAMDKLAGVTIPVRFSGTFAAPSYTIDFKRLFKSLVSKEVGKKKGELFKKVLGEDAEVGEKPRTKDLLKGLLKKKLTD